MQNAPMASHVRGVELILLTDFGKGRTSLPGHSITTNTSNFNLSGTWHFRGIAFLKRERCVSDLSYDQRRPVWEASDNSVGANPRPRG